MPLPIGTRLGHYEIIGVLGAGGMGEVYKAKDVRLAREVAIKVLPEHLAADEQARARFEREARAVAALSHPSILALHEFNTDGDVTFAVTELLEGETLRERLNKGPLPWREAADVAAAIADGLAAAHAKGIVHRDIKPENIFLTGAGQVKVLDFGLARFVVASADEVSDLTKTTPGTLVGTVTYMAPEQIRGEGPSDRSDIFSFGTVLYEMVTGEQPFQGETATAMLAAVLTHEPRPLSATGVSLSPDFASVIEHCLEKDPKDRFPSARELVVTLRGISSGSGIPSGFLHTAKKKVRKTIDSIAVLPVAHTGADEFLSVGLTESLISTLSELPKLRVMASSTVLRFVDTVRTPQQIGRELGVRAVLSGTLRFEDLLDLHLELVDSNDGAFIWGAHYERRLSDFFALQKQVGEELSAKIRPSMTRDEKKRVGKLQTESPEAYRLYLKGRYQWGKRTHESLRKGIEFFQEAIAADPGYALAYSGLADCYSLLCNYRCLVPSQGYAKAKAAALRAIELDPQLAEAHTSLAYVTMMYDWNIPAAEVGFRRALELNPNYPTAHHWYSHCFEATGRYEEALDTIRRAQQLDPLSLVIDVIVGFHLYVARHYDAAIAQLQMVIEMDPNFVRAHSDISEVYLEKGMNEDAVRHYIRARTLVGEPRLTLDALELAFTEGGIEGFFRRRLELVEEKVRREYVAPIDLGSLHIRLGQKDQAFHWLEKAEEEHSDTLVFLNRPIYDTIRSDPRFVELVKRVGVLVDRDSQPQ